MIEAKAKDLIAKLDQSADQYSLQEEVFELVDVYNCGSFAYAMQNIRNTASAVAPSVTNAPPADPAKPAAH